jgi:hypothetical protein
VPKKVLIMLVFLRSIMKFHISIQIVTKRL